MDKLYTIARAAEGTTTTIGEGNSNRFVCFKQETIPTSFLSPPLLSLFLTSTSHFSLQDSTPYLDLIQFINSYQLSYLTWRLLRNGNGRKYHPQPNIYISIDGY